ncbi:MAG: hypothetical protein M0Z53_13505 [Thermaerobacter sp.]|nr:hypothetical protein [Thermaerobacter sp.]
MQSWQDEAWATWDRSQVRFLAEDMVIGLASLAPHERRKWILRAARPANPVATGMARWLSSGLEGLWWALPGVGWERAEVAGGTLLAYPEALGFDPLAMAGLGAVWADDDAERMAWMVQRLGGALIPAVDAGQIALGCEAALRQEYHAVYAGREHDAGTVRYVWPPWPLQADGYREQLLYGVVPHDAGGQSPQNPTAVLLALHDVPDEQRRQSAGLAYKAIEGCWLTRLWAGKELSGGY